MKCARTHFTIEQIVNAWRSGSLKRNNEYQRGAAWKQTQMQGLIDSAFRDYPLPPVFLHKITEQGLGGDVATRYDVVDGQQRIRAFAEFFADAFVLLKPEDKLLRMPDSLRVTSAPWGGRTYSQLDTSQKQYLQTFKLECFLIEEVSNPDEIRDLFIRLQSGTALSRQQIRDAWPGNLGPFIESLAGKLNRHPSADLFDLIDRRSDRGDEDFDIYTVDRQICAQLFALYQARSSDRLNVPSIGADDLDRVYHANTKFDPNGITAQNFRNCLGWTSNVIRAANAMSSASGKGKNKHKKLDIVSVFFLMQDYATNPSFKWTSDFAKQVAAYILDSPSAQKVGKSTNGRSIAQYYEVWRSKLPEKLGVRLDSQRLFNDAQKREIALASNGACAICKQKVKEGEAEYDHYPVPHYLGGKTDVLNGRLVCSTCHPRGRPLSELSNY